MSRSFATCLFGMLLAACTSLPGRPPVMLDVPAATAQVLLCTTASWNDTAAVVCRYERTRDGWTQIGRPIPAQVGRSGLGWGIGLHRDGNGPQKREGDGRAPAGIFRLGPAFGYAATPPAGVSMPWRHATDRDYFVDAVDSPAYNQWQRIADDEPNDPAQRWSSCERMRRDDHVYELGVVVGHNTEDCIPGRGSAIFLHVWRAPGVATSGCTSMARSDMLTVLRWLRPEAQPLLVQMPSNATPRR